jgi:hypothetical protein
MCNRNIIDLLTQKSVSLISVTKLGAHKTYSTKNVTVYYYSDIFSGGKIKILVKRTIILVVKCFSHRSKPKIYYSAPTPTCYTESRSTSDSSCCCFRVIGDRPPPAFLTSHDSSGTVGGGIGVSLNLDPGSVAARLKSAPYEFRIEYRGGSVLKHLFRPGHWS